MSSAFPNSARFRYDLHRHQDSCGELVCIDRTHQADERSMRVIDVSRPLRETSRIRV